jgi:hypothetical protein
MNGLWRRLLPSFCCAALLLGYAPRAFAQSATSAAAEQLFQDGKRLFDAGKTHEACEKFAASQEAEAGLGTLLHLASCHEKEGKTASAWAEFNDAMAQAQNRGEKDREKFARDHAQALEKQLHRVVLEMMSRPEGLEIKLDGKPFPAGSLGTAIPLDPGAHALEVRATRKKAWTQQLSLGPGAVTERLEIPVLADDPTAAASPAGGQKGEDRGSNKAYVVEPGTPPDMTKRVIGFVVGGAGLVLLGVAALEGLTLMSKNSTANDHYDAAAKIPGCTAQSPCQERTYGDEAHDNAKKAQVYMFLSGGAGVIATGVGVFLVATSFGSPGKTVTTGTTLQPVVGPGTVGLRGTF